jgi:hypothetical protein
MFYVLFFLGKCTEITGNVKNHGKVRYGYGPNAIWDGLSNFNR